MVNKTACRTGAPRRVSKIALMLAASAVTLTAPGLAAAPAEAKPKKGDVLWEECVVYISPGDASMMCPVVGGIPIILEAPDPAGMRRAG